ncbi:MAG TPA: hypothetical protein VJS11_13015 [Acidobacteriaceae bacterium]|nr:hypothetical protein [Acidobacteriaceae bacterium]
MIRAHALVVVGILLSGTLMLQAHAQQCEQRQKLSADEKKQVLNQDLDRGDRAAVLCAIAFMDDLSLAQDPGAMQLITRYLDLRSPETPEEIGPFNHFQAYGGEFPAINCMIRYRKKAIPALLAAIGDAVPGSLQAHNAVRAFMWIEAPDPPAGVRLLVQAAGKEHGNGYEALMDAAEYAASQYQCRSTAQPCQEPLNMGPQ